ncbi:hypothetical protein CSUB01_04374 [Colletotrichum sublineola]|uniref:Uncharacterized protein n=1 Tax=Colletotrichum sublineola TaxID=1173701 RepID=A0A066XYK1_COLSU|nr:hypothetical protein CSUB01_04374 [Colletotrichum sublineola]
MGVGAIKAGATGRAKELGFDSTSGSDIAGKDSFVEYQESTYALKQCREDTKQLCDSVVAKNQARREAIEAGDAVFKSYTESLGGNVLETALRLVVEVIANRPAGEIDSDLDAFKKLLPHLRRKQKDLPPDKDIPLSSRPLDQDNATEADESVRLRETMQDRELKMAKAQGALLDKDRQIAYANTPHRREAEGARDEAQECGGFFGRGIGAAQCKESFQEEVVYDSEDDSEGIIHVKKQLAQAQASEAKISLDNTRLEEENQQLKDALESVTAELRVEKESHEGIKSELEHVKTDRSKILAENQQEILAVRNQLVEAEDKYETFSELALSRKFKILQDSLILNHLESELKGAKLELEKTAATLSDNQKRMEDATIRADGLQTANKRLESANKDATARADSLTQEVSKLQIVNETLESANKDATARAESATVRADGLAHEASELQTANKRLESADKEKASQLSKARQKLQVEQTAGRALLEDVERLKGDAQRETSEKDANAKEAHKQKTRGDNAVAETLSLRKSLADLRDELSCVKGAARREEGDHEATKKRLAEEQDSKYMVEEQLETVLRRCDRFKDTAAGQVQGLQDRITELKGDALSATGAMQRWTEFWRQDGNGDYWAPFFEAICSREPEPTQLPYKPWQVCATWGEDVVEQDFSDRSLASVLSDVMGLLGAPEFEHNYFGALMRRLAQCLSECVNMSPDAMRLLVKRCTDRVSAEPKHTRRALHTQIAAVADVLAARWISLEDLAPPSNCVLDNMATLRATDGQLSSAWSTSMTLRVDRGDDALLLIKNPGAESALVWCIGTKTFWFASRGCAERLSAVYIKYRAPMGQQSIILSLADLESMDFIDFCN